MHELLCGPADFMSLKAREDYSTPEPLTRRPRPRLPGPTLQFLITRADSSRQRRLQSLSVAVGKLYLVSRPLFLNTTAPKQPVVCRQIVKKKEF